MAGPGGAELPGQMQTKHRAGAVLAGSGGGLGAAEELPPGPSLVVMGEVNSRQRSKDLEGTLSALPGIPSRRKQGKPG